MFPVGFAGVVERITGRLGVSRDPAAKLWKIVRFAYTSFLRIFPPGVIDQTGRHTRFPGRECRDKRDRIASGRR